MTITTEDTLKAFQQQVVAIGCCIRDNYPEGVTMRSDRIRTGSDRIFQLTTELERELHKLRIAERDD
jgi:hypothetical protein